MNVKECLKRHRSIRSFKDLPIAEGLLSEILDCAMRASTGGSMQLYSVIVSTDPDRRAALAAIHLGSDAIRSAPVTLTFCIDGRRLSRWLALHGEAAGLDNMWGFVIGFSDALLAAQNALVAAESEGLGGCFLGSTIVAAPMLARFLECPPQVVPIATLLLGHPAEAPELGTRLPQEAVVHRERYVDAPAYELRGMYDAHARAAFDRFCAVPYVGKAAEAAGVSDLAGYYARLMYPRDLLEVAGAYFQCAVQTQGFSSDAQGMRAGAVRRALSSGALGTLHPIRQLAFSMAVMSGHIDCVLDLDPVECEAIVGRFLLARDPTIFEQLTQRGIFDVQLRSTFLALLADFEAAQTSHAAAE
jgi:nitroreductase